MLLLYSLINVQINHRYSNKFVSFTLKHILVPTLPLVLDIPLCFIGLFFFYSSSEDSQQAFSRHVIVFTPFAATALGLGSVILLALWERYEHKKLKQFIDSHSIQIGKPSFTFIFVLFLHYRGITLFFPLAVRFEVILNSFMFLITPLSTPTSHFNLNHI